MVAEIGQWMAQRGQFPIQYGNDARLGRVKHQVVQAIVTVHDANHVFRAGHGWNVLRQPGHQLVHFFNRLRDGGDILLAPASNLALKIVAGFAVTRQSLLRILDAVQGRDDPVHFVVNVSTLLRRHAGQGLIPQNAPLHELHDVESPANHALVFTQAIHARHGDIGSLQPTHDGKFPLDGMGRRQQFGNRARLGPHHIALRRCAEFVRGVGLPPLE